MGCLKLWVKVWMFSPQYKRYNPCQTCPTSLSASFLYASKDTLEVSNIPSLRNLFEQHILETPRVFHKKKEKGNVLIVLKTGFSLGQLKGYFESIFWPFHFRKHSCRNPRNKKIHPNVGSPHSGMAQHPLWCWFSGMVKKEKSACKMHQGLTLSVSNHASTKP